MSKEGKLITLKSNTKKMYRDGQEINRSAFTNQLCIINKNKREFALAIAEQLNIEIIFFRSTSAGETIETVAVYGNINYCNPKCNTFRKYLNHANALSVCTDILTECDFASAENKIATSDYFSHTVSKNHEAEKIVNLFEE